MTTPVTGTGISAVTDRKWSLGVIFQLLNGHLDLIKHLDGVWKAGEQLQSTPVDGSPVASISYDSGKQVRIYYLDTNYIVQELAYTEGKGWYAGAIGNSKAKATPGSGLAAVVFGKDIDGHGAAGVHIRVYYQESGTTTVRELGNDGSWYNGALSISGAAGPTGLAAVAYWFQNETQLRVYYQAQDLSLKEYGYNEGSKWFQGGFNPGKAAYETPIAAVVFGNVELQVYWHNLQGQVVFSKNTGSWGGATVIKPIGPSYKLAVIQWDSGKYLRLYTQLYNGSLAEYYSDDSGSNWSQGAFKFQ